jgi:uncharacterized protein YecE (DUF72 family)
LIYAGTSGYSFREWVGTFYPPKMKSGEFLSYYASRVSSVEVNHTFRRFPRVDTISCWSEATPESFRFSFKMHQSVTHRFRLKDVGESVRDFLDALRPLGSRLGVVLFQLPPNFRCDLERLDSFLSVLPRDRRSAIEFRHDSWNLPEVESRLREAGVALVTAEVEIQDAAAPVVTAPFAYVRLRKTPPYSDEEVATAASLLRRLSGNVEDVYLYVKHDDQGRAPLDVERIVSGGAT